MDLAERPLLAYLAVNVQGKLRGQGIGAAVSPPLFALAEASFTRPETGGGTPIFAAVGDVGVRHIIGIRLALLLF